MQRRLASEGFEIVLHLESAPDLWPQGFVAWSRQKGREPAVATASYHPEAAGRRLLSCFPPLRFSASGLEDVTFNFCSRVPKRFAANTF